MLKLENLTKVYRSKDGTDCAAIDGISISFPDNGFVFIVGKSGSGKSTLLNLMSGMDKATSGDLYIAGKSANDFTPNDFDIYRNTYVGFVFQDFSLIDSLTVGENIEMSVKLQGKSITKDEVIKTLGQVSLGEEFYARHTNELSGGQKQRIAIARALIKSPKIIFADEPTGALDAETGKQVLNIFKELSKDHLVIVVSHDTDNSLVYGDRVITLEDGKVISDKTKRYQPNLAAYKKEYQMKVDSAFKNTPKDESELKDTFTRTITKVPFKQALKIGTESFKKKKVHFIITMFLTVVALAVFAVANIMRAYSPVEASLMTFDKLDIKTLMLVNTMEKEDTEQGSGGMISFIEDTREETVFTVPLAEAVENKINGVMRAYRFNVRIPSIDGNQLNRYNLNRERQLYNTIYTNTITIFTELNNNGQISDFYDAKVILGRMPQENQTAVEIMISDYTADSIMFFGGRFSAGEVVYPNTGHEQILDKIFVYNGIPLKIVGIFDTDYEKVLAYYLENPTANMKNDFRAKFNLTNIYTASLTSNAAIYSQMQKNPLTPVQLALYTGDGSDYLDISAMYLIDANTIGEQFAATNSLLPEDIIFYDGATADTVIGDNDLVLPFSYISGLLGNVDFENLTAAMLGGLQFNISVIDENHKKLYTNPNILAVYNDEALSNDLEQERSIILLSADKRNEALLVNLVIANLYVPIGESEKANSQLLNYFDSNNLWYMTYATGELKAFSELFFIISDLLNWVSLIMFVFVLILISNFIASGIKAKTHEIGVLRALGARGKDVAKIFAIEGGVIFILQVLFSYMMIFIGVMCLNALLTKAFVTTLVLLRVSPLSLLLVALIGAFTVSLASVLPLSRLTKMKPAEVMRARE